MDRADVDELLDTEHRLSQVERDCSKLLSTDYRLTRLERESERRGAAMAALLLALCLGLYFVYSGVLKVDLAALHG